MCSVGVVGKSCDLFAPLVFPLLVAFCFWQLWVVQGLQSIKQETECAVDSNRPLLHELRSVKRSNNISVLQTDLRFKKATLKIHIYVYQDEQRCLCDHFLIFVGLFFVQEYLRSSGLQTWINKYFLTADKRLNLSKVYKSDNRPMRSWILNK